MKITEKKLRFMVKNWSKMTIKELEEKLGVSDSTIYYWAHQYRKLGGNLPRRAGKRQRLGEEILLKIMKECEN